MKTNCLFSASLIAAGALLATGSAHATAGEVVDAVVNKASGVAVTVEHAVKRGVKAAASGVETGAKAVGAAADKVAKSVGLPPSSPASAASAPRS